MHPTPPTATIVMNHYVALGCASEEMLDAARRGHWDSVMRLEAACTVIILRLRELAQTAILTTAQKRQRAHILQTIMANDAEVCRICDQLPATVPANKVHMHTGSTMLH